MDQDNAELHKKIDSVQNSVDRIEEVLIGDKFNKKGIIQIQQEQEERLCKIEVFHSQNKWLRGIAIAGLGIITGIVGFLIKLWNL